MGTHGNRPHGTGGSIVYFVLQYIRVCTNETELVPPGLDKGEVCCWPSRWCQVFGLAVVRGSGEDGTALELEFIGRRGGRVVRLGAAVVSICSYHHRSCRPRSVFVVLNLLFASPSARKRKLNFTSSQHRVLVCIVTACFPLALD